MSVLSIVPADKGGCAFYRMEQPGKRYADLTKTPLAIHAAGNKLPSIPQWQSAMDNLGVTTAVIARTFEDHQRNYWVSLKRALPGLRLAMDFDDLLWNPCPLSSFKPTPMMLKNLDLVANISDVLTASTKPMADALWHRYKKKARIVPNMVDEGIFRRPVRRSPRERMRIVWAGSATHQRDMMLIEDAVLKTADKYEWHFMGWMPDSLKGKARYHDGVDMEQYIDKLASIRAHVGVAPLAATAFNKCKSNVKLLEYGALGMATIASAVYPYKPSAARLVTTGTADEWIAALSDMENEQIRQENAKASQDYARSFSITNRDQEILNAYK